MKKARQIANNVYWVGARDYNCRHFHGELYPVEEGVTYNAYLVMDDQITLFDTVEEEFSAESLERIQSVLDGKPIDNIILQHAEPDHSGALIEMKKIYPDANVYSSPGGIRNIQAQFDIDFDIQPLKTGDTLNTGKYNFTFMEMQMIHWPDNMLTYSPELKIVFSNDAFGQHIVNFQLTDQGYSKDYCMTMAKEYFANIVIPYIPQVQGKLQAILDMNLDIEMIAPSHGIIWKDYVQDIIATYQDIAQVKQKDKVVIVFESVWNHTQEMAEALAEGFADAGKEVKLYKLSNTESSILFREIMDAKLVCVGSGTYNNELSYGVAGFIQHLKSSRPKNKKGLAFGAYGWFPKVAGMVHAKCEEAGLEMVNDAIAQNFQPNENELESYYNLAQEIAKTL